MTILITGATGNIGRPLVDHLLNQGHAIRALTRNPSGAGLPAAADVVQGDLSDLDSVRKALTGVEQLHLITFTGDFQPLARPAEICALAQDAGVRHVTVLQGGYPGPVEEAVRASGLSWTGIQPVEFMSNTLEWAEGIKTEGVVREGFAQVRSTVVHEKDVAAVTAAALTDSGHAGTTYTVTGPEALTAPERVEVLADVLGRPVRFVEMANDEVIQQWKTEGYSEEDVKYFLEMRLDPPEISYTVQHTVEEVAKTKPHTFRDWVVENHKSFR